MLEGLIDDGIVPGDGPYQSRFLDFIERYRRVAVWELTEPADQLGTANTRIGMAPTSIRAPRCAVHWSGACTTAAPSAPAWRKSRTTYGIACSPGKPLNKWSRTMRTSCLMRKSATCWLTTLVLLGALGALSACSGESRTDRSANAAGGAGEEKIYGGGVRGLNYSPNYIHSFRVSGPRGMNGGGGNMNRAGKEGPGAAGERCCIGIPQPWKPDTKLEIEWELDRSPYDNDIQNGLAVMRATVTVPEYGPDTYGFYAIFLPGDRVKVMVKDGNANGHNSVKAKPEDNDPYVAQGVRDDALTEEMKGRYR
ncbi:DUF3304 domain-containing protein [Cupriavidus oxalaticus]|uniref:DUF3304 domain-containing protein n=1 Tax=Cupriavidus oxalaticus TaxID=96344 RepID=UPI00317C32DD